MQAIFVVVAVTATVLCASDARALSQQDWLTEIGVLAAEQQQVAPAPQPGPAPVKPPQSQCAVCRGTGRVRTGDGISWTACDACVPDASIASDCPCGASCDCNPCVCNAVAMATRGDCPGGVCPTAGGPSGCIDDRGNCDAERCGAGGCRGGDCGAGNCHAAGYWHGGNAHEGHGAWSYHAGQPARNVARFGGRVLTARWRARREHGGPFPLFRAWRCRRGRCG